MVEHFPNNLPIITSKSEINLIHFPPNTPHTAIHCIQVDFRYGFMCLVIKINIIQLCLLRIASISAARDRKNRAKKVMDSFAGIIYDLTLASITLKPFLHLQVLSPTLIQWARA